jgi:hypothetical protein
LGEDTLTGVRLDLTFVGSGLSLEFAHVLEQIRRRSVRPGPVTARAGAAPQHHGAVRIDAMHRESALCQIDSDGSNVAHGLPLSIQIENSHAQSWHFDAVSGRGSPLHSLGGTFKLVDFGVIESRHSLCQETER